MIACSRSPRARSDAVISAILASTSLSPAAFSCSAFSSRLRALIAARSSSENPLTFLLLIETSSYGLTWVGNRAGVRTPTGAARPGALYLRRYHQDLIAIRVMQIEPLHA